MVGVVSLIGSGGNFIFADFEIPRCQFLYKNARNVRYVLFRENLTTIQVFYFQLFVRDGKSYLTNGYVYTICL